MVGGAGLLVGLAKEARLLLGEEREQGMDVVAQEGHGRGVHAGMGHNVR